MAAPNFFTIFTDTLNENDLDYFVTGSIAALVYGEPRLTYDIDLVIFLSESNLKRFLNAFPEHSFYIPPIEVIQNEMKRENEGHINLIHHESGFKADIYFIGNDSFIEWAFENRKEITLENSSIYIAPPEYVIIKKLEYYRMGKGEKHITDIENILKFSGDLIDRTFLSIKITEFNLTDTWTRIKI